MFADATAEIVVGTIGAPSVAKIILGGLELPAGIGNGAGDRKVYGIEKCGFTEAIRADEAENGTLNIGASIRFVRVEVEIRKCDPCDRRQRYSAIYNVRHSASPASDSC